MLYSPATGGHGRPRAALGGHGRPRAHGRLLAATGGHRRPRTSDSLACLCVFRIGVHGFFEMRVAQDLHIVVSILFRRRPCVKVCGLVLKEPSDRNDRTRPSHGPPAVTADSIPAETLRGGDRDGSDGKTTTTCRTPSGTPTSNDRHGGPHLSPSLIPPGVQRMATTATTTTAVAAMAARVDDDHQQYAESPALFVMKR